jgi:pimeloyl-ACP methyl ester carboxylesterase
VGAAGALHVTVWGEGEPAVFVHGSFGRGTETWRAQRPLGDRHRLILVDRRGFGASPGPDRGDWELDARDLANLLPSGGAHVVGHSYGGVSSLLAAARRPDAIRSLTVIEPPALALARGGAAAEEFIRRIAAAKAEAGDADDYRRRFVAGFGFEPPRDPLRGEDRRGGISSWRERPPWDAEVPLAELRAAAFPKLVVRGAWDQTPPDARAVAMPALHRVCDVLVDKLSAESATFQGAAHNPQLLGEPFNERLLDFWQSASS